MDYVRKGGAAARAMLVQAAAQRWNVSVTECNAANSIITHAPSGRTLRYGEVAANAAKLSGKQMFAIDVQLPDMLNSAIALCSVYGSTLIAFDADIIKSMPGVRHVVSAERRRVAGSRGGGGRGDIG